jgi:hypothetical protein
VAVQAGIGATEFWGLTPYLSWQAVPAAADRATIAAWRVAYYQRVKKLPRIEGELLQGKGRGRRDMESGLKDLLSGMRPKKASNG